MKPAGSFALFDRDFWRTAEGIAQSMLPSDKKGELILSSAAINGIKLEWM